MYLGNNITHGPHQQTPVCSSDFREDHADTLEEVLSKGGINILTGSGNYDSTDDESGQDRQRRDLKETPDPTSFLPFGWRFQDLFNNGLRDFRFIVLFFAQGNTSLESGFHNFFALSFFDLFGDDTGHK